MSFYEQRDRRFAADPPSNCSPVVSGIFRKGDLGPAKASQRVSKVRMPHRSSKMSHLSPITRDILS